MRQLEPYFNQITEEFDPDLGLILPDQLAYAVRLPLSFDPEDPGAAWLACLRALLRDPEAPHLHTLLLEDWSEAAPDPADIDFESGDARILIARHGQRLKALRRLFIGANPHGGEPWEGFCRGLGRAFEALPALRHLHLRGQSGLDLLPPSGHPRLESLHIHIKDSGNDLLDTLFEASFPALRLLDLWEPPELAYVLDEDALSPLLSGKLLPALEHLALRSRSYTVMAQLLELLQAAPLGAHLRALSLTHCIELDDDTLTPLLASPWLSRLELLDLRGAVGISDATLAALRARVPRVLAGRLDSSASLIALAQEASLPTGAGG